MVKEQRSIRHGFVNHLNVPVVISTLSTRLIPNFRVSLPCWRGTTVSLEINPFIRLHDKRNRSGMDSK